MKLIFAIAFIHLSALLMSQTTLKVEVSADTITPEEFVEITYTIENGDGRFEGPDLSGLPVVSGPNTSSSYMIQNGKKSSSQSYSYFLRPINEGILLIPPAFYHEGGNKLMIESVSIMVISPTPPPITMEKTRQTQSSKVPREKRKF